MQIEALPYKTPANPYRASSARAPSSIAAPSPVSPLRWAARQVLPGCRGWRVRTAPGARIWLLAAFWARSTGMRLSLQGQGWSWGTGKPSLGIISAAARGSCLHPDKCWALYHGAGVAPVPLHPPPSSTAACSAPSQQQDQCIPWDTHIGMSVGAPNPGFLGGHYTQERLGMVTARPPHLPPWTTQDWSQPPPEWWDTPTPYCAMQDQSLRLSKGKRKLLLTLTCLAALPCRDIWKNKKQKKKKKKPNNFIFSNKIRSKVTVAFPCPVRSKYTQKNIEIT